MYRSFLIAALCILLMPVPALAGSGLDLSAYPLLFKRAGQIPAERDLREIVIVGDLMFTRGVDRVTSVDGMDAPMNRVAKWIVSADLAVANYEGTIANEATGRRRSGPYRFKAKPEAADAIANAGFDLVSVANNHSQDWGPAALQNTVAYLHLAGVKTVGAWSSFEGAHRMRFMDAGGIKTVWLAYNYVGHAEKTEQSGSLGWSRAWLKRERLLSQVAEAKKLGGIVIVYPHWGEEYTNKPRLWQVRLAREAIDAGADLVVGHHPHVIQTVERYGKGLIAYSLGNFLFDQPKRDSGLALWVRVDKKGVVDIHGLTCRPYTRPEWHDPETARKFVRKYYSSTRYPSTSAKATADKVPSTQYGKSEIK